MKSLCNLEKHCELPCNNKVQSCRKTKIVCTVGPACGNVETLVNMMKAGMNVARFNFSHGTHDYHRNMMKTVREAAALTSEEIAIALDTKGPEIRTGRTKEDQTINFTKGQSLVVTTDDQYKEDCCSERIYVDYKALSKSVKVGQTILIADGALMLKVTQILNDKEIQAESLCQASFGSRKNVSLTGSVKILLPTLAQKDIDDIVFGLEEGIDMIFASFIRSADNVKEIRALLNKYENGKNVKIISKIESMEGVDNIDEIIAESDGIMVARGDLGMSADMWELPGMQKMIIVKCNCAGKPVICATQMMESMIKCPCPTRAEVTDVHNAVLDGSDCVMLSGESANGQNPIAVVEMMHKICVYAELSRCLPSIHEDLRKCENYRRRSSHKGCSPNPPDLYSLIGRSAADIALGVGAKAIICLSTRGETARCISHARPHCPVLMVTRSHQVARQSQLFSGVIPVICKTPVLTAASSDKWNTDVEERLQLAVQWGIDHGHINTENSKIVFVYGSLPNPGNSNNIQVLDVDISSKKAVGHRLNKN